MALLPNATILHAIS